jgi:hypothetical protein
VMTGVVAQCGKGLFHVEALPLGDDSFGLLDDDAAGERMVELSVEDLGR